MGLKNFLREQGFITDEPGHPANDDQHGAGASQPVPTITPTIFPHQVTTFAESGQTTPDPSFVTPLPQRSNEQEQLDPTFVKFFEDEMVKANLPGADYFEFRLSLMKTQQKMAASGITAPQVVLQAVLMSFEAQDVTMDKLKETAMHYKDVLKHKNDDFLKGAEAEKNTQLQKRQSALQAHNDAVSKMQQQLDALDVQKKQLTDQMAKEKTQMEVDKNLGKEAIEKIDKAERLITLAYNHIQSSIDNDVKMLQTAKN